jgi:hypothetical protein
MDTAGTQLYTYDIVERDRYVGIPAEQRQRTFKLMIASHAPEFGANAYLREGTPIHVSLPRASGRIRHHHKSQFLAWITAPNRPLP